MGFYRMNKKLNILLLFASLFFLFSCSDFEQEQEIPAYIKFDGFRVVANPNYSYEQGADFLTNEITDVWVYVDQKYIGVYSLNKNGSSVYIPILKEGNHTIDLQPGVKYNGMAGTRDYYRFYTYHTQKYNLKQGKTIDVGTVDVMYNSDAEIEFTCFFDNGLIPFENAPITGVTDLGENNFKLINNDSVLFGNALAFYSSSSSDDYKIIMKDSVASTNRNGIVLELDYHSNIPFEIGIYGKQSGYTQYRYISCMRLNENTAWKKMYIILGKVWSQLGYQPFRIYFQPFNTKDVANGFVHIDNIKVVHYPD